MNQYIHWLTDLSYLLLTYLLAFHTEQHEFGKIIVLYTALFVCYLLILHFFPTRTESRFVGGWVVTPLAHCMLLAIATRFMLVFAVPNLSNDVYRFIWDGRLLMQGYNPFDHLPEYYLEGKVQVDGISRDLFEAFDSKNFHTVYPPIAQVQFASACALFSNSIFGSVVVMKLWLFLFEIGSLYLIVSLLRRFGKPLHHVLLYAFNPLIVIEIMGNIHFEGAMIFFLLLTLYLLFPGTDTKKIPLQRQTGAAVAFAFSVASKLLPLIFLPFLVRVTGWKKSIYFYSITGLITLLLFLPMVNATFLTNFGSSLNLYFQKLEFNASLYYVLRWIGYQVTGYNNIAVIGPLLGALSGLLILWMAFYSYLYPQYKRSTPAFTDQRAIISFIHFCLFAITLYLLCTTTIHPWYVSLPILLCVFTDFRYPVVWSYLIFWTYINYSYEPYRENLWVVAVEYILVFAWMIVEFRTNKEKILSL